LEPASADLASLFKGLITRLAKDAVDRVAEHSMGEIPAIIQLSSEALFALATEADDPNDRGQRYRSRQAVLNLLTLCEGIVRFDASKRRSQDLAALRRMITAALQDLVLEE
jgi:hypothetical protein